MNACANGHGNVAIYVFCDERVTVGCMDIWKHGTYIDLWSLVHLLSGFLLAGVFYGSGTGFLQAFIFSALLLIAWEMFEWVVKIIEPSLNVMVDIIIGLVGFFVGGYLYYKLGMPFAQSFYPILMVTLALSTWGFVDFLKRGYR